MALRTFGPAYLRVKHEFTELECSCPEIFWTSTSATEKGTLALLFGVVTKFLSSPFVFPKETKPNCMDNEELRKVENASRCNKEIFRNRPYLK